MKYVSKSQAQTISWAKKIAKNFKGGEIFGLQGNLGAGKTVIAKGFALGLGIKENINSPSFVLMKVYPVKGDIKNFVHVDTYRLSNPDELLNIGLQDYLNDSKSVVVIEWADKIKKILPKQTKYIKIDSKDENTRIINF
ncbi:MAG: tRNA (adenosine(37)-N6)-threonylcarbamoyltransferase complex ATPase subunit type 1 TsaE [bacterium]